MSKCKCLSIVDKFEIWNKIDNEMTGTKKQKLFIIRKNKNLRNFKRIKSLKTNYDFNKTTWMISEIFEKWLLDIDYKMSYDKQK